MQRDKNIFKNVLQLSIQIAPAYKYSSCQDKLDWMPTLLRALSEISFKKSYNNLLLIKDSK